MGAKELKKASDSTPTTSVTPKQTPVVVIATLPTTPKAAATLDEKIEEEYARRDADRDILSQIESEKRLSLIKAWEDSEKTKLLTKAEKGLGVLDSWEYSKKYAIYSKLKGIEEALENKKAEAAKRMKNKIAQIHREADEKRAMVKAKMGESIVTIEEKAAIYRATGSAPKNKFCGCMSF